MTSETVLGFAALRGMGVVAGSRWSASAVGVRVDVSPRGKLLWMAADELSGALG